MRGTLAASKIQVAESQCAIYVSRTKKEVLVSDIESHIHEMGEQFVSVELLTQHNETAFNSFKITIMHSKLTKFLDSNFWPAGIVYRRYWERKVRTADNKNK